jgi:pheromone shutdown protein TraB
MYSLGLDINGFLNAVGVASHVSVRDWFTVPTWLAASVLYVIVTGVVFGVGPNERSFQVLLFLMLFGVWLVHYGHSILDWFVTSAGLAATNPNPVSLFRALLAAGMFAALIAMHYNILADDFTRRMLGRGVAAEEALPIRGHMVKLLAPILGTAAAVVAAMGLVAEFSQLVFGTQGLFPKLEIVLLGVLGVGIGALLLSILRDYYGKRRDGGTND